MLEAVLQSILLALGTQIGHWMRKGVTSSLQGAVLLRVGF